MTVNVVSFLFSWCWGPLCWVLAFFTASYQQLLWTPIHQGPKPLRPGEAFPTTSSPTGCNSTGTWLPSWLRYIIIQRPHDHPLDLWNRMFNRHQAEITVMQFTGHSLPVHQSMSIPWKFFSSLHFVSQFPPTSVISSPNCHWNVSLPSGASTWNGIFGRVRRSKH